MMSRPPAHLKQDSSIQSPMYEVYTVTSGDYNKRSLQLQNAKYLGHRSSGQKGAYVKDLATVIWLVIFVKTLIFLYVGANVMYSTYTPILRPSSP